MSDFALHRLVLYFHTPRSNDMGVYCLESMSCLLVCLLSTLTYAITFEPLEIETSYFGCLLG